MDTKVYAAQKWYNANYKGYNWYSRIDEDGITGAGTCKALCKALQFEIGLSGIDGIIGPGTLAACPTIGPTTSNKNLIIIIQCGFYCKGYECGDISGIYNASTTSAAIYFREDAGFPNTNGTMPPLFIWALLNTDAFILTAMGKTYVRSAQQYLNASYMCKLPNWPLIPCNGVPDRSMMKAIIAALQYEEAGKTTIGVDGIYGDNTLNKAPRLSQGTSQNAYVKIVQMCLMCMMEINPGLNGAFDDGLKNKIIEFQEFYCLTSASSGLVDITTWASLLSSKGYALRPALACDASTQLTPGMAQALYNADYRYIGRYLTGTVGSGADLRPKNLTVSELHSIFNAKLSAFAIFQEGGVSLTKFTYERGRSDAQTAIKAAKQLGIPRNEIIYFAIDYDMMDGDVTNYVIPYFRGLRKTINDDRNSYRIGIYGSRNVCTRVADAGYSVSSFVSDMSTGFSGNLGYKIPSNWAFDQFREFKFTGGGTEFGLDNNAYSGKYSGFNTLVTYTETDPIPEPTQEILEDRYRELLKILKVSPGLNIKLEKEYTIDTPVMSITYTGSAEQIIEKNPEYDWSSFPIRNNALDSSTVDAANSFITSLDTSIQADLEGIGGISVVSKLTSEITNGSVAVGIGIEGGFLKITYAVEEQVWATPASSFVLSMQVSILYRNQPMTPKLISEIKLSLAAYALGIAVILLAITVGSEVIYVLSEVLKLFKPRPLQ